MRNRAIVLSRVPCTRKRIGQLDHVRYFGGSVALVQIHERLVGDELIDGGGVFEVFVHDVVADMGPIVRLEGEFGLRSVASLRFHEVVRPGVSVANFGAAQRVQVVQSARAVFGNPQRAAVGKPRVHFGGGLGAGRHLEFHFDAVDRARFARVGNRIVRRQVGDGAR